jgi:hypothetical protein
MVKFEVFPSQVLDEKFYRVVGNGIHTKCVALFKSKAAAQEAADRLNSISRDGESVEEFIGRAILNYSE